MRDLEEQLAKRAIVGNDRSGVPVSYFQAPSKFLGDQSILYGGTLSFDIKPFVGNVSFPMQDVVLVGGGLVLTIDALPAEGSQTLKE